MPLTTKNSTKVKDVVTMDDFQLQPVSVNIDSGQTMLTVTISKIAPYLRIVHIAGSVTNVTSSNTKLQVADIPTTENRPIDFVRIATIYGNGNFEFTPNSQSGKINFTSNGATGTVVVGADLFYRSNGI